MRHGPGNYSCIRDKHISSVDVRDGGGGVRDGMRGGGDGVRSGSNGMRYDGDGVRSGSDGMRYGDGVRGGDSNGVGGGDGVRGDKHPQIIMSVDTDHLPGMVAAMSSLLKHTSNPKLLTFHVVVAGLGKRSIKDFLSCHNLSLGNQVGEWLLRKISSYIFSS